MKEREDEDWLSEAERGTDRQNHKITGERERVRENCEKQSDKGEGERKKYWRQKDQNKMRMNINDRITQRKSERMRD